MPVGAARHLTVNLVRIAMMRQLLDVVHHAVALSLPVHLAAATQGEAREALIVTQVDEHRFDRGEARNDHALAGVRADLHLHPLAMSLRLDALARKERNLPRLRDVGLFPALAAQFAGQAVALGCWSRPSSPGSVLPMARQTESQPFDAQPATLADSRRHRYGSDGSRQHRRGQGGISTSIETTRCATKR